MSINEMFNTTESVAESNTRRLSGTAALTAYSSGKVQELLLKAEADLETFRPIIRESAVSSEVLDKFITSNLELTTEAVAGCSEEELEKMLKSQQSKRSRTKSKQMTMPNYQSLVNAAIAEHVIRLALGRDKTSSGRKLSVSADLTPARLEELANDQEALRKEIRNVQSKKSICKAREDFDPESERWQQLLKMEQQLKELRKGSSVDHTKEALSGLLEGVDFEHLKAADAKELLSKIAELK